MSTAAATEPALATLAVPFDVPVALFIYNRPVPTRRVLAAIAAVRPAVLLIVGDGARENRAGDAERVAQARAIVDLIDWPCDIRTNFAAHNLGSRRRVSSGIDWVFTQVDRAIILEDDCVPVPAFFRYCREMLNLYRDDRRVQSISGSDFARRDEPAGHYLSNFALMWGWATWADRWADYRVDPVDAAAVVDRQWGRSPIRWAYWRRIFTALAAQQMDAWDYQWILTLWRRKTLCVRPTVNLVHNIGFGADATHTTVTGTALGRMTAVDTPASFVDRVGPVAADRARDAIDERIWAQICVRSLVLMYLPWLRRPDWLRR